MGKKLSLDEYVLRVREINPAIKVLGTYVNSATKILHRCHCGREWNVAPSSILCSNAKSCRKCNDLSHDEYVARIKKINPKFEVIGTYVNLTTKILHRCSCGKEWNVIPYDVINGKSKSCRKCSSTNTHYDYVAKLKEINPLIEVLGTYISSKTKIFHKCSCGRAWNVAPSLILSGHSKSCGKCDSLSHDEYVLKVKQVNPFIKVIGKYININTKVLHKCSCGKAWYPRPFDVLNGKSKSCGKCKDIIGSISVGNVYNNWTVLNIEHNENDKVFRPKVFCKCSCEKIQYVDSYDLVNGKTKQCRQCSDTEAGLKKKYSHEQYLKRLVEIGSNVKVKEGCFYKGNGIKLTHVCTVCGGDWKVKPNVVLNGSTMCLKCSHSANESLMAIALKQLFKHYYPKTEWECDLGFRGKFGGVSPYDIYVPELNLVVECQSQYHDDSEHRELDLMKRRYALDKGYLYKEIDHRNISVLEAIQQFFPELNEVPDYVDLTKNVTRSWSLERAQELLNKGFSYKDVSEAVNTRKQSIASAVMKRQLVMPVGYIPRNKREWSLEEAQKLLNEERYTYSKISEILGKGCTTDAISMAVTQGLLIRAKYKAKRIIRNPRRQRIAIVQLNLDGEIVNRYEGISFIQGFGRGAVSNACKGKGKCKDVTRKHEYMGYQWYYEDDDN